VLTLATDSGTMRTTVYHPFWVERGRDLGERSVPRELSPVEDQGFSLEGRWGNSHELCVGDVLIGQDGSRRALLRIEQEFKSAFPVNNLTIDEDHTFAVGPDGVLVHNTDGCGAISIAGSQLQRKFKHAGDFGIAGTPNKVNLQAYENAIKQHVKSPTTLAVIGTYRGNPVSIHVDPSTGLAVITDRTGNFISGWKLNIQQLWHVLNGGNLGGG